MIATLQLPLPPSVNAYWRNFHGRIILSQAARDYKIQVKQAVSLARTPYFGANRLHAIITIFPRDKRKSDLDNRCKGLFDALQHAGIFDDDSQFDKIEIAKGSIKTGGGCTIVIATMED